MDSPIALNTTARGNDGERSAATIGRQPGFIHTALGIALTLVVLQGMRITTLAGIYPTDVSLIARHGFAVLVLLACLLFAVFRGRTVKGRMFDSTAVFATSSILLSASLFMKYSRFVFGSTSIEVEIAGKVLEEGFVCLAIVYWGASALKTGPRSLEIFALGCLIGSGIQLVLSFLQQVPCMVAISCMPLVSAFLFARCKVLSKDAEEGPFDDAEDALLLDSPSKVAYLVTTFCMSFVLGNIIFSSLETQDAASSSPVFQLSIIAGNALAGVILLNLVPKLSTQQAFTAFLLGSTALSAFALYLSTFLSGEAVTWYLAVGSLSNNAVHTLAWTAPFVFGGVKARRPLVPLIVAYGAFFSAKLLSAVCMFLAGGGRSSGYSIIVSVALICLFAAALALMYNISQSDESAAREVSKKAVEKQKAEKKDKDKEPNEPTPASAANEETAQREQAEPDDTSDDGPREQGRSHDGEDEEPTAGQESADGLPQKESVEKRRDEAAAPSPSPEGRSYFKDSISHLASECHLTKQETKVLSLVARGMNAKSIAEDLTLSTNTVKSHMRNLYAKLGVHSQQEVIALIRKNKK